MLEVDGFAIASANSVLDSAELWRHQRRRQWPEKSHIFWKLHHTGHYHFVIKSLDYIENCENG